MADAGNWIIEYAVFGDKEHFVELEALGDRLAAAAPPNEATPAKREYLMTLARIKDRQQFRADNPGLRYPVLDDVINAQVKDCRVLDDLYNLFEGVLDDLYNLIEGV